MSQVSLANKNGYAGNRPMQLTNPAPTYLHASDLDASLEGSFDGIGGKVNQPDAPDLARRPPCLSPLLGRRLLVRQPLQCPQGGDRVVTLQT